MEKITINFESSGESGNTMYLLCLMREALRKRRRIADCNELFDKVFASGSYEEALGHMRRYADVIDLDGKY